MGEIGTKEDDIILHTINENPIKALNNYVNCNFNNTMGYSDIINEITKLNNILSDAHYIIEPYVINDLLKYNVSILLLPISLGSVGTLLFFYSVAGMLLKILSKCKGMYFKILFQ